MFAAVKQFHRAANQKKMDRAHARESHSSSGDEISINEEDQADEIPEEDDRSKSAGYSSAGGMSLYNN